MYFMQQGWAGGVTCYVAALFFCAVLAAQRPAERCILCSKTGLDVSRVMSQHYVFVRYEQPRDRQIFLCV